MDEITVASLQKNRRERLLVMLREYQGHRIVDLRIHAPNGEGELRPTPKGVSIRPDLLRPVIDALEAAEREARAQGMLP